MATLRASVITLLAALVLPRAAAAEPASKIAFRVDLQALPGRACPTAEEFGLILAAEFGYLLVRDDARATLRIETHPNGNKLDAVITAPDPQNNGEWRRVLTQGNCRELLYDVAVLVYLAFGPRAWRGPEPPPWLVAPVTFEVGRPVLDFEPSAAITRILHPAEEADEAAYEPAVVVAKEPLPRPTVEDRPPFKVEAALGPVVMPHGLTSVAVGGNGLVGVRWGSFGFAGELRGVVTPASGIGDRELPGRTGLWTASLMPCFAADHFDVCGVASFSKIDFLLPETYPITTVDAATFGIGVRANGRLQLSPRFALLGYGDVNMQLRSIAIQPDPREGSFLPDWRSPLLRITLGIAVAAKISN